MTWIQRAKSALRKSVAEIERSAHDEAHLATRGDRPFPGCQPDAPSEQAAERANPKAKKRGSKT